MSNMSGNNDLYISLFVTQSYCITSEGSEHSTQVGLAFLLGAFPSFLKCYCVKKSLEKNIFLLCSTEENHAGLECQEE